MSRIERIEIKQYRGLKNIELKNLSHINVLVGENNSGKTSVLEAIQLLSNPFSESLLFNVTLRRMRSALIESNSQMGEILKWIFPQGCEGHLPIVLKLQHDDMQTSVSFELFKQDFVDIDMLMKSKEALFTINSGMPIKTELEIQVKVGDLEKTLVMSKKFPVENKSENHLFKATNIIHGDVFRMISAEQVGAVILDQKKDELIEILKQFDNVITGIEIIPFLKSNQIYLQKNNKELIPLSSFGDGLQKVVYIASKLLNLKDDTLLLDDAEVSIHTKMMPIFFKWLSKLALKHNVIIFMTTHSLEVVDGVLAANKESLESLSFYRLKNEKVKYFRGQDVYELRTQFGQDMRG